MSPDRLTSVSSVPLPVRPLAERIDQLDGADERRGQLTEHDIRNALGVHYSALMRGKKSPFRKEIVELTALRRYLQEPGHGIAIDSGPFSNRDAIGASIPAMPLTDLAIDVYVYDAGGKELLWHGSPGVDGSLDIRAGVRPGRSVRILVAFDSATVYDRTQPLSAGMQLTPEWPADLPRVMHQYGLNWVLPRQPVPADQAWATLTGRNIDEAAEALASLRDLAGGDEESLAVALAFLAENRGLLPASLDGRLPLVARFVAGHRATPLTRAFVRGTLTALLYTPEPGALQTGRGPAAGVPADASDWAPSSTPTSLLRRGFRQELWPVNGGFSIPMRFDSVFGARVDEVSSGELDRLLRRYRDRIRLGTRDRTAHDNLMRAIQSAGRDRYVFTALEQFFADGGTLIATQGGGRYQSADAPPIAVGSLLSADEVESTFVHELLHYVFDKSDAVLGEARDGGGSDHPAIGALVARHRLARELGKGRIPTDRELSLPMTTAMVQAIEANDVEALRALADPETAARQTIVRNLPVPFTFPGREDSYGYTPDQLADMAFVWGQVGVILAESARLLADTAQSEGISLADALTSHRYEQAVALRVRGYLGTLALAPELGAVGALDHIEPDAGS